MQTEHGTVEVDKLKTKLYLLEDLPETLRLAEDQNAELQAHLFRLRQEYAQLKSEYEQIKREHGELQATLSGVVQSHSWRLTAPLRAVIALVKKN